MPVNCRRPSFFSRALFQTFLAFALLFLLVLPFAAADAAQLKEARVSQVIRDVKILPGQAAPRPARVSDEVRNGTAVRTGIESRAELTFTDQTLARLGANTIFSFDKGTRNLELGGGVMLLRVPKDAGGAQINTAAVTAAITGTTVMLEYHPDAFIKFIILEGTGRIFRKDHLGESVLLHAGQMLIVSPNGKGLPDPVDVDLERLMKTSLLINGFPPLPSSNLIARAINSQDAKKNEGDLIETNLVIFGGGTIVSLLDPTYSNTIDQANDNETRRSTPTPTPITPPPVPSKFGPPTVIASSTPYAIGSGTVIQTDPTITTNGTTDFGKIYRGPEIDGLFSAYAFGSTSAFDIASGFDDQIDDSGAVFKFTSLQLTGDPTISTTNGEINLALIGVNGITSGGPGGTLTFAGLNGLLLATENGSITLGSEISFEGLNDLTFYARGAGSNLTLACDISTLNQLNLYSEGAVNLSGAISTVDFLSFSGGDFNLTAGSIDAQTISIFSGADANLSPDGSLVFNTIAFLVEADGDIVSDDSLEVTQVNSNQGESLTTTLLAGGGITGGGSLTLVNDNSGGGDLEAGGDIILNAGGDINVAGDLILNVLNNGGGHIGVGGDIFVSTGGDLVVGSIDALINNRDGGTIDNGGNLIFDIGGGLTTTGDASLVISTRNDGAGGGTIGSDVFLSLNAGSVNTGGFLALAISANAGGNIPSALLNVSVPGDLVATGGAFFNIQSTGFNVFGGPFLGGGMIAGDAVLNLSLGNVSAGDLFDVEIDNNGDGSIGGNAIMIVTASGSFNIQGDAFFDIINTADLDGETVVPGGTIGGDASVTVAVAGDIVTLGNCEFAVLNNDLRFLSGAGTIGGNASVVVAANSISTGGFFQPLVNNTNGIIDGGASVTVLVTGDISVGTDTFFNILNTSGEIGRDALSTLSAVNFSSGNNFNFQILNAAGSIGGSALLTAALSGSLTSTGDAFIQIANGAGTISNDAIIDIHAASFAAASLLLQIDNAGGFIGGMSNVIFDLDGDMTINGDFTSTFANNDGGSTGTGGNIVVTTGGDLTAGSLLAQIDNSNGGTIGGTTNVAVNVTNDVTAPGGVTLQILNGNGGHIVTGADVLYSVGGSTSTTDLIEYIDNSNGGVTDNGGNVTLDTVGPVMLDGALVLEVDSFNGGTINTGANVTAHFVGDVTDTAGQFHSLNWYVLNGSGFFNPTATGGTIGTGGNITVTFDGNASTTGTSDTGSIAAEIQNGNGGSIGTGGNISMTVGGNLTAGPLFLITENQGGHIGTGGNNTLQVSGDITLQSDAQFQIFNNDNGSGPGTMGSNATINVSAANISTGGSLFDNIFNYSGGSIGGNAAINLSVGGNLTTASTGGALNATIDNTGGNIGGNAAINMNVSGSATITSDATVPSRQRRCSGGRDQY